MAIILCKDLNLNSLFSGLCAKRRIRVRGFTANLDTAPCTKSLNHRCWLFLGSSSLHLSKKGKLSYFFFWLRRIGSSGFLLFVQERYVLCP